jgi:hypothetical protein
VRFTGPQDDLRTSELILLIPQLRGAHLVINVGDVHDKVHVVAEVIPKNTSDNVLREVVAGRQSVIWPPTMW